MFTLTKWVVAPAMALGLICTADSPAHAQYGCYGPGYGYGVGYGHGVGYGGGGISIGIATGRYGGVGAYHSSLYRSRYGGYGLRYQARYPYSNRGHYDWHRTQIVPHGGHLDVYPGHWDYHGGRHGRHGRH